MELTDPSEDLERIRRARDGRDNSTDGPEIYVCPADGCSRTVIGDMGALRNHCHQVHGGLRLNDDLELMEVSESSDDDSTGRGYDVEEYTSTWGPGIREEVRPEDDWSIYDDYEGTWGPGVPETEVVIS